MDFKDATYWAWFESRPPEIQAAITQYPPDRLYRLKSSGHLVVLTSYVERRGTWKCAICEAGAMPGHQHLDEGSDKVTVKAAVLRNFNPGLSFERMVFGIPLSDLEDIGPLPGQDKQAP